MSGRDQTMIVKVQAPLMGRRDHVLVYDQDRRHVAELPFSRDIERALAGDPKGYFRAARVGRQWQIGERVGAQDW